MTGMSSGGLLGTNQLSSSTHKSQTASGHDQPSDNRYPCLDLVWRRVCMVCLLSRLSFPGTQDDPTIALRAPASQQAGRVRCLHLPKLSSCADPNI